ncbi:uncharacterized protein LOC131693011 [Topomyia yanbarensis]|uniref:uncharacterized protein LOC131693011 n=1 Tax=Topomyia yanbarensis TaxID=2498891 RepID=UPI00273B2EF0|nr:uncharacterized protein LOC131693011 [Topomyia yanbarensis]XP_058836438.1 uncharacterized protein LOC131693011 [Topomyia yanbarensis]XP_058836439.1 uncharacterized protein LOC131693011 [Topomyia yanbarensis]
MSTTSSVNSSTASSNSGNVLSSASSNIVILENQVLDSNDVVAAAGLQQLSNAGNLKLSRDCAAVQYSNLINSYTASSINNSNSGSGSNSGSTIVGNNSSQMSTVNIIPGDASQTSSRVQVLSNVQLVSKGGSQPSTFSYVDASGKNFNVLTSSGKLGSNKLISVPITKVKTFNHLAPQQQQQQQNQTVSSPVQNQPQKVTVPRSIQLVTRLPNSTISVSNGRVSQIAPTLSSSPQQQFTIQQYPDSSVNYPTSTIANTSTNTGSKTVSAKGKTSASVKMMQNSQIGQIGTKTTIGKSMSVSLKSVRTNSKAAMSGVNSQYYVKSSTNGTMQQLGTTTSIYTTSPAQAVYHNPTPHPHPQPVMNPFGTTPNASGKGRSVYKTSKNQLIQLQHQQQQQPHQSPQRSVTPSPSPVSAILQNASYGGSSATIVQSNNRYQQNYHTAPPTQSSITTSNYKPLNHLYTGVPTSTVYDSSNSSTSSVDHSVPSVTVTGYSSSTGKGKKYTAIVNNDVAVSPVKVRGVGRGRNNSLSASYQQQDNTTTYQRYSASPSRTPQQQFHPPPLTSTVYQSQSATSARDDQQLFINGQQMRDETSARILQSLSSKTSDSGKYIYGKQQQTFSFYGSDSVPQTPSNFTNAVSANPSATVVYDPSDSRFYEDKPDGRRTSTSEIITYADNIPLREGYPPSYSYNHREDDDQIGVEVRPAPVDTSNGRYHILQAILQDHTYFAALPELKLPEPPPPTQESSSLPPSQQNQPPQSIASNVHLSQKSLKVQSSLPSSSCGGGSIASAAAVMTHSPSAVVAPGSVAVPTASVPAPLTQMSLSTLAAITAPSSSSSGSISVNPFTGGSTLDYYQRQSVAAVAASAASAQDDDANSVISTGSRNLNSMDIDLGEETETAPEGEGEDDSVTRCICDLTHDDGYMICCDKCSAWQHVDCMGIDRLNIPDEYNCEMCQPRPVDKNRARLLQLEKRKEQSLFLANNNLQLPLADSSVSSSNLVNASVGVVSSSGGKGANQYTTGKAVAGSKKNKSGSSAKKKATDGSMTKKSSKKSGESALNRVNGKRKELKKPSKKKVKSNEPNAEKMTNMIRTWIDNYERAITNHYSPELRARLQAFGKMQTQNPLLNTDRLIQANTVINLQQKCTTVPHAGGKILISTGDIEPKAPIIEIRGKYMLSSQHKPLQSLFNMAANGKLANNKNAGPFLFLYQLTTGGMELCVDTRTYGNDARFIRRSCRPNAEILHNVEKGVVHLYIVSTTNIKANTEITIKHDDQLIQRVGGIVILTHTTVTNLCACGLIKECQYSAQLSEGLFPVTAAAGTVCPLPNNSGMLQGGPGAVSSTGPSKPVKNKKNNGALGDGDKKPAKKRNSRSTSSNAEARLRSVSSSGDSANEMMLYAQHHQQQQPPQSPLSQPPVMGQQPPLSPLQQSQFPQMPPHLISQQTALHFIHQQQQQQQQQQMQQQHQMQQHQQLQQQHKQPQPLSLGNPSMVQSQPVYMYSPSPTHQPTSMMISQQNNYPVHPQTPPPMSPVMGMTNRPGYYTEIKSPLKSPPLNLSGPPPLVIPTMPSPSKTMIHVPQEHQNSPVAPSNPLVQHSPLSEEQPRMEVIQHQQHYHQQQIMEDILKIKIKSPTVSPVKQELAKSPAPVCMLSPPPPPPVPIVQRLLSAETLKSELFHSHYQQHQPQDMHAPPLAAMRESAVSSPQPQSPVKVEFTPPKLEIKQEPLLLSPQRSVAPVIPPVECVKVKEEEEVKIESVVETSQIVPKDEPSELLSPKREPSPAPSDMDDSKEEIVPLVAVSNTSLSGSATNSPVKSQSTTTATTPVASEPVEKNSSNSTNSSPNSSSHTQTNSGSKKKSCSFPKDNETVKEEKKPSRKLTREERKMEAIVKAFEKMEQSQQRKQELKEQRKEGKRRSVSSSTPDEGGGVPAVVGTGSAKKQSPISSQKRKKKKSKSLSQHFGSPNQSRKKKVSKSTKSSTKKGLHARTKTSEQSNKRSHDSETVELQQTPSLSTEQSEPMSFFGDDVKPIPADDPTGTTALTNNNNNEESELPLSQSGIADLPPLSSACMLIEAAVGPLEQASSTTPTEQDFKFPQKAKTKKSMSREWLSGQTSGDLPLMPNRRITPDHDSGYLSEEKSLDYRRVMVDEGIATPLGVDVGEPSICVVAKKVEEFIAQNSPQSDDISGHKWEDKATVSSSNCQTPTGGGNVSESASVKKRWLRQAISEETDELMHASNSSPPPNGFTTPLKKRRVIRQSDDEPQSQIQTQPPQSFQSAQKIDFAGQAQQHQQQQQSQSAANSPKQTYHETSLYWSNSGPPPLAYSTRSHMIIDEKQAMDLSRTAPVRVSHQARIQPYKNFPIAQALTPLHFTDPDPLPVPAITTISHPVIAPSPILVQTQNHQLIPQDSFEIRPLNHSYEPLPVPAPSAVAAIVPASLIPPELRPTLAPVTQQHARLDMSYSGSYHQTLTPDVSSSSTPIRSITRSKGSQKYIGSPAKFQPSSPADSQSSCSVAETPEKSSFVSTESGCNSDIDEEQSPPKLTADQQVPMLYTEQIPVEVAQEASSNLVDKEETVSYSNELLAVADAVQNEVPVELEVGGECAIVQEEVVEKEPTTFVVQEEQVVMSEVVVEQEMEPMDTSGDTVTNDESDLFESQGDESIEEHQNRPPSPAPVEVSSLSLQTKTVEASALNGNENLRPVAGLGKNRDENELEDLQKVIASFHSENIMNLISRNKKTKSFSREDIGEGKPRLKRQLRSKHSFADSPLASPPPSTFVEFEQVETPDEGTMVEEEALAVSLDSSNIPVTVHTTEEEPVSAIPTLVRSYSHSSWLSATGSFRESTTEERSFSTLRSDIPPISYNPPSTYQSTAARNLLSSLSVGSEPLSTLGSYRSSSSSFLDYPKSSITTGSSGVGSSIYQYRPSTEISTLLEKGFSSSRPTSFSSLSGSILGLERSNSTPSSTVLSSSTLGTSTAKVTDNLSTLGGSNNTSYPKIFTKTASSDPRLNPALTVPEPPAPITPKRKLSINEYRQRKMQTCTATTTTTMASSSSDGIPAIATSTSSASSSGSNSRDGCTGSNLISSSVESSDVSSSICKELNLELELELSKSEEEEEEEEEEDSIRGKSGNSSPNNESLTTSISLTVSGSGEPSSTGDAV